MYKSPAKAKNGWYLKLDANKHCQKPVASPRSESRDNRKAPSYWGARTFLCRSVYPEASEGIELKLAGKVSRKISNEIKDGDVE